MLTAKELRAAMDRGMVSTYYEMRDAATASYERLLNDRVTMAEQAKNPSVDLGADAWVFMDGCIEAAKAEVDRYTDLIRKGEK